MTQILAIDQGSTSSRAIPFDGRRQVLVTAQDMFSQHDPALGWVEHDPMAFWSTVAASPRDSAAIGSIDQPKTTLIWDVPGGRGPVTNAGSPLICNSAKGEWDAEIRALLGIPTAILPPVKDRADLFGRETPTLGGAGHQQAAMIGQACFRPGRMKSTDAILRVDAGMSVSRRAMRALINILGTPVDRPVVSETRALGAACLAGVQAGLYSPPTEFQKGWTLERRFTPQMDTAKRHGKYTRWGRAIAATMAV